MQEISTNPICGDIPFFGFMSLEDYGRQTKKTSPLISSLPFAFELNGSQKKKGRTISSWFDNARRPFKAGLLLFFFLLSVQVTNEIITGRQKRKLHK